MHSAAFLALVASLVASSFAAAIAYSRVEPIVGQHNSAANASIGLGKRGNIGGVYFCQEFDFQDPSSCQYQIAALKTCVNLGPDFDNQISSFGPDDCTVCHVFDAADCQEPELRQFFGPGDSRGDGGVGEPIGDFNKKISSFSCDTFCPAPSAST